MLSRIRTRFVIVSLVAVCAVIAAIGMPESWRAVLANSPGGFAIAKTGLDLANNGAEAGLRAGDPAVVFSASPAASLTGVGVFYTQNFDTLVSTGTGTEAANTPQGWTFSEALAQADTSYAAGDGGGNTGNTYSFGTGTSAERAFGGLRSGSLNPTLGAQFTNNTGSALTQLNINYTGEQWRQGAPSIDRLDFQFSTNATSLTTGTWTDVNGLDFLAPAVTGTALDGNAAANRRFVSGAITGVNIANGASFWIRWLDFVESGADDALAVDEFSMLPVAGGAANPAIGATKVDSIFTDTDGDGRADPGDVLQYTVTIGNGGSQATGVRFEDIINDPNLTLDAGSIMATSLAANDTFGASGNIPIAPAGSVLANDINPITGTNAGLTVTAVQGAPANVGVATNTNSAGIGGVTGSVTMAAAGTFTYQPPPGFTGSDTFTYSVGNSTATVSITISNMVWFISNTGGGANLGTFSDPFTTIASFNAINTGAAPNAQPGHHIVIRNAGGTYNEADGINFRNTQTLTGAAVAFNTVFTADANSTSAYNTFAASTGAAPTINATAGDAVDLASGNAVRGLNVGNTPGFFGFDGGAVGSLTIGTVNKTGTGGAIRVLTSGSFGSNVNFGTLESTSSSGDSILLLGVTGTLGVASGGTGLSGMTFTGVGIVGGSVSLNYPGNMTKTTAGALIDIQGAHSGTVTFSGTLTSGAGGGTGFNFDNADGTYNFTGTSTLTSNAAVSIANGSGGTFSFGTGTSINNTLAGTTAFLISGGTASVTYSGGITKTGTGAAVGITGNHTAGTVTFQTGTINASGTGGGLSTSDADGTYNFTGTTSFTGQTGINIANNSGGTFNFSTGTHSINTASGISFREDLSTANITYNGTPSPAG